MSRSIRSVEGVIEFTDGERVEFLINREGSSRWGNVREVLADAVEPCEQMGAALATNDLFGGDDDE